MVVKIEALLVPCVAHHNAVDVKVNIFDHRPTLSPQLSHLQLTNKIKQPDDSDNDTDLKLLND